MGLLKTSSDFCGITFKGLSADYDTTFLHESLVAGSMPRPTTDGIPQLLLSQTTVRKLQLHLGDRIFAYFLSNESMRARRFVVCGIFETNMSEYDTHYAITDLATVQRLNGWKADESSGYEITIRVHALPMFPLIWHLSSTTVLTIVEYRMEFSIFENLHPIPSRGWLC